MYALVFNEQIDLASYIFDTMIRVATKPAADEGLPFGSFITRWAKQHKLTIGPVEDKQLPPPTINHRTRVFCEAHRNKGTTIRTVPSIATNTADSTLHSAIQELKSIMQIGFDSIRGAIEQTRTEFQDEIAALRDELGLQPRKKTTQNIGFQHSSHGEEPFNT